MESTVTILDGATFTKMMRGALSAIKERGKATSWR